MKQRHSPLEVIPPDLALAVRDFPNWFVIGGHAVRCFLPYRPSDDVDFGVPKPKDLAQLVRRLQKHGKAEILERSQGTVHLRFDDSDVSIFVLPELVPYVENHALNLTGILATKLHAVLDRGTRRDFFDLYVLLELHRLGVVECLSAVREVYGSEVNDGLVLRALTYFDDAEGEAKLPGEGPRDWTLLKRFFTERAGSLIVPPPRPLDIAARTVIPTQPTRSPRRTRKSAKSKRKRTR